MGSLSPTHWIIVLIVAAILFFGWKQLPDMARSAGKSLRIFKTEMRGMTEDDKAREAQPPVAPTPPPLPPTPPVAPPAPPTAAAPTPPASTSTPPATDNHTTRAE
jgi:sec-independent protein translocase protein TatA